MPNEHSNSVRIQQLNDAFRRSFVGGVVVVTAGLESLPAERRGLILAKVRAFDQFNEDNDPHGSTTSASSTTAKSAACGRSTTTIETWSSCRPIRPTPRPPRAC